MHGELGCHRIDLGPEHFAMLGRCGSNLADHSGQGATAFSIVAVGGGQVPLEDNLGAIGSRLLVESAKEALAQSSRRPLKNLIDELFL
ncbi:MAG: hypothetical protein ACLQVI_32430 [Polyangiaceae bacterium]